LSKKLLEVNGLEKSFKINKGWFQKTRFIQAVNGVSFSINERETFGIVGESGCGKSTTGRCLLRLVQPTDGEIIFQGNEITKLNKSDLKRIRKDIQMVFQNPLSSMNPKLTIREILSEPLIAHKVPIKEQYDQAKKCLELVGLSESHLTRYPHEFSGGQRQRIGIARALILKPKIIVADEPVSALDVSVQSQILNLMQDLQDELGISFIFISHDLGVVEHIAHRVGVMYLGEMVEIGHKKDLFEKPLHPYTQALISAVPKSDPDEKRERIILKGELPSPSNPPNGCKFHPRCQFVMDKCKTKKPEIRIVDGSSVACHLY